MPKKRRAKDADKCPQCNKITGGPRDVWVLSICDFVCSEACAALVQRKAFMAAFDKLDKAERQRYEARKKATRKTK